MNKNEKPFFSVGSDYGKGVEKEKGRKRKRETKPHIKRKKEREK